MKYTAQENNVGRIPVQFLCSCVTPALGKAHQISMFKPDDN